MDHNHLDAIYVDINGFAVCGICRYHILFECPECFCILRFLSANHNCPGTNNDQGLGLDMELDSEENTIFQYILQNKHYKLIPFY